MATMVENLSTLAGPDVIRHLISFGRHAAMVELVVVLVVPPIVGLVTYFVVRLLWERDENGGRHRIPTRDVPKSGPWSSRSERTAQGGCETDSVTIAVYATTR
jgi:hypothetical protein